MRKYKHVVIGVIIVIITLLGLYFYYQYTEKYPSTDNAYVNANLVNIAPKIGGYVMQIKIKNNQMVQAGEVLMTINPQDYSLMLDKAKQDLMVAQDQEANAQQQIAIAKAAYMKAKNDYIFSQELVNRYAQLYNKKAGSLQDMQKYQNQSNAAKQILKQSLININQANINYRNAKTQIEIAKTGIKNASNNNEYTIIKAPVSGYISNLNLQVGELIAPGQKIFGIVDNNKWWVDANFKETQLKHIKPGQTAEIQLDMYNHKYHGIVDSISYASGNTFSLLPAENATGNWVKVTQRFTVRVKIDNAEKYPLRVGASSEVKINTDYKYA